MASKQACSAHVLGSGGRFELQEPLLCLQQVVMGLLADQQGSSEALVQIAVGARKAGQHMRSMAAIHEIHSLLHTARLAAGYGPCTACRHTKRRF